MGLTLRYSAAVSNLTTQHSSIVTSLIDVLDTALFFRSNRASLNCLSVNPSVRPQNVVLISVKFSI